MKIVIDGNIGSGKSTLMNNLENYYNINNENVLLDILGTKNHSGIINSIEITQEPVSLWKPYLDNFYNDMRNNCLSLQMKILKHHLSVPHGKSGDKLDISITERSTISCIDIFGKNSYNNGFMTNLDIDLMKDYDNTFAVYPELIVYIYTTPNECLRRINTRNRSSENLISIEYLKDIDTLYKEKYNSSNNDFHLIRDIDMYHYKKTNKINYCVINGDVSIREIFNNTKQFINIYLRKSIYSSL